MDCTSQQILWHRILYQVSFTNVLSVLDWRWSPNFALIMDEHRFYVRPLVAMGQELVVFQVVNRRNTHMNIYL